MIWKSLHSAVIEMLHSVPIFQGFQSCKTNKQKTIRIVKPVKQFNSLPKPTEPA